MRAPLLLLLLATASAFADVDVSFDPHPGAQVPGLDRYFAGTPIVLVLGYLGCVNLCGTTLAGVDQALRDTKLVPERDYRALFVSIDPRDEKTQPERRPGWHFVTGARAAERMAQAVGFRYRYEEASGQFAHPAGFIVLTPDAKVSRYFEGVRFDDVELKNAIVEARQGQVQSTWQRLVLVCFHDPLLGRNTPAVMAAVRIVMLLLLLGAGFFAWRRLR